MRGVNDGIVMEGMSGRMNELEVTPSQATTLAILHNLHPLGGNGHEIAI